METLKLIKGWRPPPPPKQLVTGWSPAGSTEAPAADRRLILVFQETEGRRKKREISGSGCFIIWDLDELRDGRRICCGHSGRQGSPYAGLSERSGGEDVGIMMNANVSDSAAATQQHLVLHRALVYIKKIQGWSCGHVKGKRPLRPVTLSELLLKPLTHGVEPEDSDVMQHGTMDAAEFRSRGKEMVDYVADYLANIEQRPVYSDVKPGYLRSLIPTEAPLEPENYEDVTHWNSPYFYAYFPTASSYPAMLADMLCGAIGSMGFTWLETVMLDWLGKMLKLPEHFIAGTHGQGGGVIQSTASEATLMSLLAARCKAIQQVQASNPGRPEAEILPKLVAYTSEQKVPTDDSYAVGGGVFKKMLEEDKAAGLIPFYMCATLGTTPSCGFDRITELGPICNEENMWMHIDAAYAGSAFICPEFRPLLNGVEFADSFNFNPHKWLLTNFDCSTMWVKNRHDIIGVFKHSEQPFYLKHKSQESGLVTDYRIIPVSIKLQEAKAMTTPLFCRIGRFHTGEDFAPLSCGLSSGSNQLTELLLKRITESREIHLVPCLLSGRFVLRFAICARTTDSRHIRQAWKHITQLTSEILQEPRQ
ncbi:hypothetical protein FQN60_000336 [Etheostoma spectabile]|uniref:Aromatic-L-amino-acid decarboxylase n=1 Tax=Etheostoma spectabile TaxID=54343 RepID=A0A5J5D0S2_9PERO|nr:hypothetical protein FQN60_000336 [Etheostoma spectabile]